MRILVDGATKTMKRLATDNEEVLGVLATPGGGGRRAYIESIGLPFGVDNGAATKAGFEPAAYLEMLAGLIGLPGCMFVAAPDSVYVDDAGNFIGDAKATLEKFSAWGPMIRELGFPVAMVAQDGVEKMSIPWDRFDALFIGGGTKWKLSSGSIDLCREAKRRGKHVHCGRVNTLTRIKIAVEMGADSFDGSRASRWSDDYLPTAIAWVKSELRQGLLWGHK